MRKQTAAIVSALLLLTPTSTFAGDKIAEQEKGKPQVVTVGGNVIRPNTIKLPAKATVYSMILAAGGPTELGSLKRVKVIRDGKASYLDLTKEKTKNDEFAKAGDAIEVPKDDGKKQ